MHPGLVAMHDPSPRGLLDDGLAECPLLQNQRRHPNAQVCLRAAGSRRGDGAALPALRIARVL